MEHYEFLRVVGKGSYGEYVIKKQNPKTKRERRAAEQEAQLLSQLKHLNIVTYRESWEGKDHQLYIVMGFCEGGDLYHRLKQQNGELLPERQLPQMPKNYDPQLGDLIRCMLSNRPDDRPDIHQMLQNPYLKQQYAVIVEYFKEIAPYDVASLNAKHTDHLDCPRPAGVAAVTHKEKKSSCHHSNEEECSSSTSSTECSEGDYREGKSESNKTKEMVQMMMRGLLIDIRDLWCEQQSSRSNSAMLPEFKLNRKYRDTLMLHGKSGERDSDYNLIDLCSDDSSRLAKIRRAVAQLRIDLVKGLGVKLLDKVLDIMKEEDEDKRDVMLRQQMGEEPYRLFIVKVWQLKFFEDI
ncbi:serine/threonine-protein kinase Nek4 isoform X1 [Silurus meridionalis]|nr:serine/threonine-protein kinase Nek4 isoform X1 [Silurus meridionalis]